MKHIFLDVDGTIVNYENKIPKTALGALNQARMNGHSIYFVTGRSKSETITGAEDVIYDGYIGGNGNYIELSDKVISHKFMCKEECKIIVDYLIENNLEFFIETNHGLYASENFDEVARPVVQKYVSEKEILM